MDKFSILLLLLCAAPSLCHDPSFYGLYDNGDGKYTRDGEDKDGNLYTVTMTIDDSGKARFHVEPLDKPVDGSIKEYDKYFLFGGTHKIPLYWERVDGEWTSKDDLTDSSPDEDHKDKSGADGGTRSIQEPQGMTREVSIIRRAVIGFGNIFRWLLHLKPKPLVED